MKYVCNSTLLYLLYSHTLLQDGVLYIVTCQALALYYSCFCVHLSLASADMQLQHNQHPTLPVVTSF